MHTPHNDAFHPLKPSEPLPHRKVLRSWLASSTAHRTWYAIFLIAFDYTLLLAALFGTVHFSGWLFKVACGTAAGFLIGRLFIVGHDAAHHSLTPHRRLNAILGRLAFLPSITPYSLWEVGHNVVHHGYTNLKGFDFVWSPLTREEFDALSFKDRLLNRIYRSGWAPGLYYMVEIWWKRMFFPSKAFMGARRSIFLLDCVLVAVAGLVWISILVWASLMTQQSILAVLVSGFAIPFFFWCSMIGFVVYVQHTHVKISWYDDRKEWARAQPFISTTVHLTFRLRFGAVLHHIMEHTAHHLDMGIPLYRLKQAQETLESLLPERIVIQPFSFRWYFDTARRCKLYDFEHHRWTNYAGVPTSDDYAPA